MPRQADDSPTIPGFEPVLADVALETAELPRGGDASSTTVDVLANFDMDDTLRSMLEGTMDSPHILPLVYADLRGRLSSVLEAARDVGDLRSRLGSIALDLSDARTHLRSVENEVSTLRREDSTLHERVRSLEGERSASGSHSPAASNAASLHIPQRDDAPLQPAIAAPVEQRPVPPPHTTATPAAPLHVPPVSFQEFMAHVPGMPMPQVGTVPMSAAHPLNNAAHRGTTSLVTACEAPMPFIPSSNRMGQAPGTSDVPGPYCPGLMPLTTLLAPFTDVISYRTYRLRNTRGEVTLSESGHVTRLKRRFDDLYPSFVPFEGSNPIRLLEFLTTLRDGFNALDASEAVAALLLTYYLDGSAKTLYATQRSSGVRSEAGALAATWPYLVHELIKRYLTDDVLQSAYEQVTDAKQKSNEDENAFADRIAKAARDCCNVFRDRELVNYYIRGLLPSTRDVVTERVRQLALHEQGNLTVARRIAVAEGNTFRARQRVSNTSTPTKAKTRSHTMYMPEQDEAPTPSPFRRNPNMPHMFAGPDSYGADLRARDPQHAHEIACNLESLLYTGVSNAPKAPTSPSESEPSFEDPALQRPYRPPPELTAEQIEKARLVIPTEYWGLNCWSCRSEGHSTFTCDKLTPAQPLYFAYCYYVYQCKANSHLAEWYRQRRAASQQGGSVFETTSSTKGFAIPTVTRTFESRAIFEQTLPE